MVGVLDSWPAVGGTVAPLLHGSLGLRACSGHLGQWQGFLDPVPWPQLVHTVTLPH